MSDKEAYYSSLNMEDITDVDYRHAERLLKYFDNYDNNNNNNQNLLYYHDLFV